MAVTGGLLHAPDMVVAGGLFHIDPSSSHIKVKLQLHQTTDTCTCSAHDRDRPFVMLTDMSMTVCHVD